MRITIIVKGVRRKMNPCNFKDMIDLGRNKKIKTLYNIAVFAQDIEDQLWDGYPYVYPSMRILIENFFDYIIDTLKEKGLFEISFNRAQGMDLHKLVTFFEKCQADGTFLNEMKEGIIVQNKTVFSISAKEEFVRNYFLAMGISESTDETWGTFTLVKNLNTRSHKMDLLNDYSSEEIWNIYKNRFIIMETIHEGIFRGFAEAAFSASGNSNVSWPVKKYHMPNNNELELIIKKYKTRQEKYITGKSRL